MAGIEKNDNSGIKHCLRLVKLVVDRHADAILGNDGDFPLIVDGSGIAASDFKYTV